MPRRLPEPVEPPEQILWSDLPRVFWIGLLTAIGVGVVSGALWIAWRLVDLHLLH